MSYSVQRRKYHSLLPLSSPMLIGIFSVLGRSSLPHLRFRLCLHELQSVVEGLIFALWVCSMPKTCPCVPGLKCEESRRKDIQMLNDLRAVNRVGRCPSMITWCIWGVHTWWKFLVLLHTICKVQCRIFVTERRAPLVRRLRMYNDIRELSKKYYLTTFLSLELRVQQMEEG